MAGMQQILGKIKNCKKLAGLRRVGNCGILSIKEKEICRIVRNKQMDRREEFLDIGERIRGAVQDAIDSGDFGRINYMVQDTAKTALQEVRHQVGEGLERLQTGPRVGYVSNVRKNRRLPRQYFRRKGKPIGVLMSVFGGFGLFVFGLTFCLMLFGFLVDPDSSIAVALIFFAGFTVGSVGLLKAGRKIRERLKWAERYAKILKDTMYMEVEELAVRVGQDVRRVRRNLKDMLRVGVFPEGHLDTNGTLFVLNDEVWEQYLLAQKSWRQKKELQQEASMPEEPELLSEEQEIEAEGLVYMDKLRQLNTRIASEAISNKLYQLDYLLQRIFVVIKEHPSQSSKMQKFMEYYLPTTVKLIESYADFDKAGIRSEHIQSAKTEIEKTLDSINDAFEKLLDEMYQNAAFEAAADAKVLKTVLAQDGYMKSEFSANAGEEG